MTYDTMNPVPSIDPRDVDDNAGAFDRFLNSDAASEPDRRGNLRKTWHQMEQDSAALVSPNVSALSAVAAGVNKAVYFSAASPVAMSTYDLSAYVRSISNAVDSAAFRTAIVSAKSGINNDITSLTGLTTGLSVAQGGTGATDAATARGNLSGAKSGANNDITSITGLTTPLSLAQGGTGAAPAAFTAFTLSNSWAVISGRRAAYRKVMDMVQIDFQASGGTATNGTLLATLPVGLRPPFPIALPVVSGPNTTPSTTVAGPRVIIDTDGAITCQNCSSTPGVGFYTIFATI